MNTFELTLSFLAGAAVYFLWQINCAVWQTDERNRRFFEALGARKDRKDWRAKE